MKQFFNGKSMIYIIAIIVAIGIFKANESIKFDWLMLIYSIVIGVLSVVAFFFLIDALQQKRDLDRQIITNTKGTYTDGDIIYCYGLPLRDKQPGRLKYNNEKKKFFIVWPDGVELEVERKYYASVEHFYRNHFKS